VGVKVKHEKRSVVRGASGGGTETTFGTEYLVNAKTTLGGNCILGALWENRTPQQTRRVAAQMNQDGPSMEVEGRGVAVETHRQMEYPRKGGKISSPTDTTKGGKENKNGSGEALGGKKRRGTV